MVLGPRTVTAPSPITVALRHRRGRRSDPPAHMLYSSWRPPLALPCPPVTVLIALRVADGVVLAADRAAADIRHEVMPGVPFVYPDVTKVVAGPEAAVALGGWARVLTSQGSIDLLAEVAAVVASASDGAVAAAAVRTIFDARAGVVRAHAPNLGASNLDPLSQSVLSVALIAGTSPSGPALFQVVLPWRGPCTLNEVTARAVAYAPTVDAALEAEAELLNAALAPSSEALELVGGVVRRVGVQMPALVALDWEHTLVSATGPGSVVRHVYQRRELPHGY